MLWVRVRPLASSRCLGVGRIPALKRLARIEARHRLVRSVGENFVFDHHQVQEAHYGALPPSPTTEYHAVIAHVLETRERAIAKDPKDLDGALSVQLCDHLLKGAQGERALRYLEAALDYLEAGYLNDQAVTLAGRALEARDLVNGADRVSLLVRKAARLSVLGRRQEQCAALEAALPLAEDLGLPGLVARARMALGRYLDDLGRYDEARRIGKLALDAAKSAGDRKAEASARGNLGFGLLNKGSHEEARAHIESSLTIYREIGNLRGEALATQNLGNVLFAQGRYEEARVHRERALVISREIGFRQGEALATGNLGNVLFAQGRYKEARNHYERSLAIEREIGDRRMEATQHSTT